MTPGAMRKAVRALEGLAGGDRRHPSTQFVPPRVVLTHPPLLVSREPVVAQAGLWKGRNLGGQLDSRRQFTAAPRAVRRAVEAMREEPGRPFTVTDLAEVAGVSRRSLQQGFQRYVGMSPMTYLREVRLGRAHDELRYSDPADVSVAEIAHCYGFLHLGRFAALYRQRYGESPSHTLRH